jgi:hypothetical protein
MDLKRVKNLIFLSIFIGAIIVPTSAFASSYTVQSASNTEISQAISNFFSLFNINTTSGYVQNTIINSSNYSSNDSNELFDCFWNWLCSGNNNDGKNGKCVKRMITILAIITDV